MELQSAFNNINWFSVLIASISAFALGSLWYTPVLFGNAWAKELKISDEDIKSTNMIMIFGLAFVLQFIAALVLDMFIGADATISNCLPADL
jgi:hypothetical protein